MSKVAVEDRLFHKAVQNDTDEVMLQGKGNSSRCRFPVLDVSGFHLCRFSTRAQDPQLCKKSMCYRIIEFRKRYKVVAILLISPFTRKPEPRARRSRKQPWYRRPADKDVSKMQA